MGDKALIELTRDELEILTAALGLATGAAMRAGFPELSRSILCLANKIYANNPSWEPNKVSDEAAS